MAAAAAAAGAAAAHRELSPGRIWVWFNEEMFVRYTTQPCVIQLDETSAKALWIEHMRPLKGTVAHEVKDGVDYVRVCVHEERLALCGLAVAPEELDRWIGVIHDA